MARGDGFSIIKRKRGGRELGHWQVRVQVPAEWQQAVGKPEVLRSTGTGDRRTAVQLAPQIVTALYAEWQSKAGTAPSPALTDPKAVAVRIGFDSTFAAMEERRKAWPANDADYAAKLAEREADLRRMMRWLQDGDLSQWEGVADRAIAKRDLPIVKGSAEYEAFVQALAEASIDAVGTFNRKHAGELEAAPRSAIVQEAKAKEATKAKAGETLIELFEAWGAEMLAKGEKDGKRGKRPDTVNQDRKVIQQFAAFVGRDRAVDSITPLEVAEYRDTLRKLPPKWMSKRELRDLDMRTAAAKARAEGMTHTAYTTINKHLSTISPLYTWLRKQPRWAGLGNPVDGLFYDDVKGTNPRPPFTTDALNKILGSPLFTGFKADGSEHVPGDVQADDWRRWAPLAAMFTGARIGEIAQLRLGDVRKHRGVWFVQIRHEAKEGLSTKSGESRFAAVHPSLERIGFLAFHQRRLEAGGGDLNAPLFPELSPNARGQISGTPSRWWRDYLARIGVKDPDVEGGDGFGTHSFRHTLADRFRDEAELLDNQIAVVLGHSTKTQTGKYGELPQGTVTMHKAWMNAVRFDGVKFDHLIADEEARKLAA
ncbi:MAG TPA: DUF6538 domain-containing protein [Sphingomonas sp.]|nr:DUF6538 domain-containing protein [Sphingomonas sp.]